jgi:hypothetical protein
MIALENAAVTIADLVQAERNLGHAATKTAGE